MNTTNPYLSSAAGIIKQRINELCLCGICFIWLLLYRNHLFSPWLAGFDSLIRLYHIDDTIVVYRNNPWLPTLQIYLRAISAFSDTALAYKFGLTLISVFAMCSFTLLIYRGFGFYVAMFAQAYFFLHDQWILMAFSAYMEPMLLAFLSLSGHFLLSKRKILSLLFFILATFTRPEVLIGAPIWIAFSYFCFQNLKSTFYFVVCFLPILLYYFLLRSFIPNFRPNLTIDPEMSFQIAKHMTDYIFERTYFQAMLAFSIVSLIALIFAKGYYKTHKFLLLGIMSASIAFLATLIIFAPVLSPSPLLSERSSFFSILPLCLLGSFFPAKIFRNSPKTVVSAFFLFFLTYSAIGKQSYATHVYKVSAEINSLSKYYMSSDSAVIHFCVIEGENESESIRPEYALWPLSLYARLDGLQPAAIECPPPGQNSTSTHSHPLVRIIHPNFSESLYDCRIYDEIQYFNEKRATICLQLPA